jgi:hypothetical protein
VCCDTYAFLYLVQLQDHVYAGGTRFANLPSALEGEIGEGFTEGRETSLKLFFANVLDPDINQLEATDIA